MTSHDNLLLAFYNLRMVKMAPGKHVETPEGSMQPSSRNLAGCKIPSAEKVDLHLAALVASQKKRCADLEMGLGTVTAFMS